MKNLIALCILFISAQITHAAENEKLVVSKIDRVTVFIQGAQVHRSGSTLIPKGTSYIVFDGVSAYLNQQSIQASGSGDFTIMDVQYRYHYLEPSAVENTELPSSIQRQIDKLRDSINYQSLKMASVREKLSAISFERQLIMNHPLMKGLGKPDSLELLKGVVNFMQRQLVDIADRNLAMQDLANNLQKQETDMQNRLQVLLNYNSNKPAPPQQQPTHQIIVMVNAEQAVNGKIEINYAVQNAGWNPWYDIKAKSAAEQVELTYKAAVYQQTGEDWSNVKLTVSNANPIKSSTKPLLPAWYIDFYQKVIQYKQKGMSAVPSAKYLKESESAGADEDKMVAVDDAKMASDFTERMQNFTSVEFEIDLPYQINSDGKTHFVTIAKHKLTSTFEHFLVPKLDNDAFVVAHITNWESLDLLTGSANIYFGNTYVGRTVLNPDVLGDTLDLSMGRDQTISVKRTRLQSDTKNKIIGGNKEYIATYQMDVRNNGKGNVKLTLEDQIPLTVNEKIQVELVKSDGGVLDPTTGLISWKLDLEPLKKSTLVFTYKVTYPKEEQISGL